MAGLHEKAVDLTLRRLFTPELSSCHSEQIEAATQSRNSSERGEAFTFWLSWISLPQ